MKYRHSAGFGKRMEFYIIGKMLKEGLDCYIPLVDDFGIDVVVRRSNGSFIEVQIKARSNNVKEGDSALFAAMTHEYRNNYYFIFYSERINATWIMSSDEFLSEYVTNKSGNNEGKRSIWLNERKKDKSTGVVMEYPLPRFDKYLVKDFLRLSNDI